MALDLRLAAMRGLRRQFLPPGSSFHLLPISSTPSTTSGKIHDNTTSTPVTKESTILERPTKRLRANDGTSVANAHAEPATLDLKHKSPAKCAKNTPLKDDKTAKKDDKTLSKDDTVVHEADYKFLQKMMVAVQTLNASTAARVNRCDVVIDEKDIPCHASSPWMPLLDAREGKYPTLVGVPRAWTGVYELGVAKLVKDSSPPRFTVTPSYVDSGELAYRLTFCARSDGGGRLPGITEALRSGYMIVYRLWAMTRRRAEVLERIMSASMDYPWNRVASRRTSKTIVKAAEQKRSAYISWSETRLRLFKEAVIEFGPGQWKKVVESGKSGSKYAEFTQVSELKNHWKSLQKRHPAQCVELKKAHANAKTASNAALSKISCKEFVMHKWTDVQEDALLETAARIGCELKDVIKDDIFLRTFSTRSIDLMNVRKQWDRMKKKEGGTSGLLVKMKTLNRQRFLESGAVKISDVASLHVKNLFIPAVAHFGCTSDIETRVKIEDVSSRFSSAEWTILVDATNPSEYMVSEDIKTVPGCYQLGVGPDKQHVLPTYVGCSVDVYKRVLTHGQMGPHAKSGTGIHQQHVLYPANDLPPLNCYARWRPFESKLACLMEGLYLFTYDWAWNAFGNGSLRHESTRIVPHGYQVRADAPTTSRLNHDPRPKGGPNRTFWWSPEQARLLRSAFALHGNDWQSVSELVGVSASRCIVRWRKERHVTETKADI